MGINVGSDNSPEYEVLNRIAELEKKLNELRSNQVYLFNIPHYTTDPASPTNNQIWVNDTTNTLKIRVNGVTKTVTLT